MDNTIPSWLNESFLVSALQGDSHEHCVTVTDFSASPAVAAGNNYTSHLYRVVVEYKVGHADKTEKKSLIVKMPIQKGVMHEMSQETDFFSKEPKMYNVLLPKMKKISGIKFGPKSFHCPVEKGMVIEDLKPEGYLLQDKFKQLDFEHCKLVMEKLGKFHATTVVCHNDDSQFIETIGKEAFYKNDGVMAEFKIWMSSSMQIFINTLQEIKVDPAHIDLITAKIDQLWDSTAAICQPHTNSLNVLNHGDCWSNNMLFKYNDVGKVIDVMFIDFQLLRYSSPITDILYFVYTSANEEVRENKLQDLYDIYLQTLNEMLENLGCKDRMTREEFSEKLRSASDFVLVVIGTILPFTKCEAENALDMESFDKDDVMHSNEDERILRIYRSEQFRAMLPALVRQYSSFVSS
ncbi:uncharacterized protein LOC128989770 [Macrosteles quadrilineatus]|uniref:uncharacterized protein LOC128989770 n=1 Tax=Macrosteles quadrilineatus TaxID=74068 RepID=UPI0023E2C608|nr:uncharacterized protein LOC128989770 [Macrosteles quadrilineatus]